MRLIDADKITFFDCLAKTGDRICCHTKGIVSKSAIEMQPIVKAIPINWIKNYASHKASKDLIDCYWHFWEDDVLKMVADWEEENEKSGNSD